MGPVVATLRIDGALCQGHGRCYATAPELFGADEVGNGLVLDGSIAEEAIVAARQAQAACPEDAVVIETVE